MTKLKYNYLCFLPERISPFSQITNKQASVSVQVFCFVQSEHFSLPFSSSKARRKHPLSGVNSERKLNVALHFLKCLIPDVFVIRRVKVFIRNFSEIICVFSGAPD